MIIYEYSYRNLFCSNIHVRQRKKLWVHIFHTSIDFKLWRMKGARGFFFYFSPEWMKQLKYDSAIQLTLIWSFDDNIKNPIGLMNTQHTQPKTKLNDKYKKKTEWIMQSLNLIRRTPITCFSSTRQNIIKNSFFVCKKINDERINRINFTAYSLFYISIFFDSFPIHLIIENIYT